MRPPRSDEPVRVAFVGRGSATGRAALHASAGGLEPRFFDTLGDPGALADELVAWAPEVVVALGLSALPAHVLGSLDATTLGVLVDPPEPDMGWPASELGRVEPGAFDRVVCLDSAVADLVDGELEVWRVAPLPVDDRLFADVRRPAEHPRALFVGYATEHRERFLLPAKHEYDLLHYAHGLHGEELRRVLGRVDVAVGAHGEPHDGCDDHSLVHLAAGLLLVAQPTPPSMGLEPGIDYVEVEVMDEMLTALYHLHRRPDTYDRVRLRGRAKAEEHRASRVWPRLVGDLVADVRAFGSARGPRPAAARRA